MPDTSLWWEDQAYAYWDALPVEGLAWEFLRRNSAYQGAYQSGDPNLTNWGLRTATDPDTTAYETPVHWEPTLTSSTLLFSNLAVPTASETLHIDAPTDEADPAGAFGVIGSGSSELHVSFLDTTPAPDAALCVIIPIDANIPDRIEALHRLWRILHNRPAPDQRLSRDKRHRLRQMARACDGRTHGASTRQIAAALFGGHRLDDQDWRTSSLRYTTLRLLRDGDEMIDGGYRELLHSGRADARKVPMAAPCVRK